MSRLGGRFLCADIRCEHDQVGQLGKGRNVAPFYPVAYRLGRLSLRDGALRFLQLYFFQYSQEALGGFQGIDFRGRWRRCPVAESHGNCNTRLRHTRRNLPAVGFEQGELIKMLPTGWRCAYDFHFFSRILRGSDAVLKQVPGVSRLRTCQH